MRSLSPTARVLRSAALASLLALPGGNVRAQSALPAPSAVTTTQGPVTGVTDAGVTRYLGLPYAAPPTGPRRWQPPAPGPRWTAPRAATRPGSECVQVVVGVFAAPGETGGQVRGDEDCLFLNVYAPARAAAPRPVMVWIHGGAFTSGAGSLYDGSELARREDVVVVTLNYRLGPLGFLALPGLDAEGGGTSGNYGLMDQQAALRWVRDNIAAFGGDAGNVTLFGESAGGMSTCAHLASPASAGLFHRAIIQSGLCASPGNSVTAADASRRNVAYASRLGCSRDTLACLRTLDAPKLTAGKVPGLRPLPNLVWSPVYGGPLLPRPLLDAYRAGQFNRVPVLAGTNRDEGRLFVKIAVPEGRSMSLPLYWGAAGLLGGARNVTRILNAYPARQYATPALAFSDMFTDGVFACPAVNVARALSAFTPTYAFEFADPDAVTLLTPPGDLPGLGATHSSSLVYALRTRIDGLADPADFTPAQDALSATFSRSWAQFARTGTPGLPGWSPVRGEATPVMVFTPQGAQVSDRFAQDHRCDLWSGLNLN
ncbi:carboxylesterase/lipase family protein [Deinococcus depolymerans]|uniref:Carboxylic ester hydrolase n=1 Tax=Deinococcus depolymerans TaxID=392408 RepID=A0ABP3MA88_9DEIO